MLKKIVLSIFPIETRRGKWLKTVAAKIGLAKSYIYNEHYQVWMDNTEEAKFLLPIDHDKRHAPLFSIVVPMYNTKDKYLIPLVDSITNQSFTDWELILPDGSTDNDRTDAIQKIASTDGRIKTFKLGKNEGISGNTNQGINQATGEYVVFSDHDDTLSLYALNELAAIIKKTPDVEIIYSDEDKITDDGRNRFWPHFKPNWSPHQFLTCNYTNHISAIKRSLVNEVGGLRTEYNGAQDYDLLLRIHALKGTRQVAHIPKVLYHWRVAEGSTAADFSVKDYALHAGENALRDFFEAKGFEATVSAIEDRPGFYEPFIKPSHKKTLVILGKKTDQLTSEMLRTKYQSMTETDGLAKVEFSTEEEVKDKVSELNSDDIVVRIRENILPQKTDWLLRLVGALEMSDVHAVSPRIVSYDGRIWDMGLVTNARGELEPLFKGLRPFDDTIYGHTEWIRDVDGLNNAFYACRAKDYDPNARILLPTKNEYTTIWSPVEVVFEHIIRESDTAQYNENIYIGEDSTKTVVW